MTKTKTKIDLKCNIIIIQENIKKSKDNKAIPLKHCSFEALKH